MSTLISGSGSPSGCSGYWGEVRTAGSSSTPGSSDGDGGRDGGLGLGVNGGRWDFDGGGEGEVGAADSSLSPGASDGDEGEADCDGCDAIHMANNKITSNSETTIASTLYISNHLM